MKFSIDCAELRKGLQQVINVIPSKTTLPILSHILLEAKDGRILLSATDLEVTLKTILQVPDGAIETEGSVTVPGRLIYDVVREFPNIPLNFNVSENNKIQLTSSRGRYTFNGEGSDDFPRLPEIDIKHKITLSKEKLLRQINKTIFAVSSDELRATLMGVLFQVKENEYRAVSTDGHRLVKIVDKDFSNESNVDDVIIPVKALNLVQKSVEGEGEIMISFASNYVVFDLGTASISATLIEGKYPDYEKVIPQNGAKKLLVNRERLISALRTVSVLANKITQQIKVSLEADKITITSQDMDRGEGVETLEAEFSGDPMDIGFNSVYLQDVLNHLDTEVVEFHLDTPLSPALAFPEPRKDNEDLLMLVMPIKLRD